MRLNRGTILLGLLSIIVIAAVYILSNQPGEQNATGTPTATAQSAGPLFPDIAELDNQSKIVRFEIVNTTDSSKVIMTKDAASVWTVSEATNAQELATDQTKAVGMMSNLASLAAVDKFDTDKLADFGLDAPKYTMTLTDSDGKTYVVKVGNKATTTPRYYVLVNDDTKTVNIVQGSTIDMLVNNVAIPAYVASPTPSATPTPSPNPYSEVEQTATAVVEQQQFIITLTAMAQAAEATSDVTAEATAEMAPPATDVPATKPPTATTVPATKPPTATTVPASATPRPTSTTAPASATPTVTATPTS